MKSPTKATLFGLFALLSLSACWNQSEHNKLAALRVTPEGDNGYREETGLFSPQGFTAQSVSHRLYVNAHYSKAEIEAISGRPLLMLATWNTAERYISLHRAKDTVVLDHVEYVVLEP